VAVAEEVLRFVKTLMWPGVLVLALVLFRSSIAQLLDRFEGASARQGETEVTVDFRRRADVLAASVPAQAGRVTGALDAQADARSHGGDAPISNRPATSAVRSDEVRALLSSAAELGWLRGRLGDPAPPDPTAPPGGRDSGPR
jgi:hypothetical protein